ncbi:FliH/SctL family protein [Lujinxingia litoralis]|nr:FliH/SctL family protein [Lujinxingia litoralis]
MSERADIRVLLKADTELARAVQPAFKQARVVRARVFDDLERLGETLDELRESAARELAQARAEAESIREEARAEGLREATVETLERLSMARAEYDALLKRAEPDMVRLAFQIARRLIGEALEVAPQRVEAMVAQSLELVRGKRQLLLRVHPDDLQALRQAEERLSYVVGGASVHLQADEDVERGGCLIETESGQIDARLQTQLQVLQDALLEGGQ